jgi:RNA polymerase sigma-70 factor (ECF subfamily)
LTVSSDPGSVGHGVGETPNAPDAADFALIERVAEGDEEALRELYLRHGRMVFGQIRFVVGDLGLSEEVLQDTMAAVWRGAGSYRGEASVRSWLVGIARRQARDRLRRRRPLMVSDSALVERPDAASGPDQAALGRLEMGLVAEAIAGLSVAHREVLGLVCGSGLSMNEVAAVLGVPPGTVGSRLSSARAALKTSLARRGYRR